MPMLRAPRSSRTVWLSLVAVASVACVTGCDRKTPASCGTCADGLVCAGTRCAKPCEDDSACGHTGSCDAGYCETQCATADDCPAHDADCLTAAVACELGMCVYPGACEEPLVCQGGTCRGGCVTFLDCEPAERCNESGACVDVPNPRCDSHEDCASLGAGAMCWEGTCHLACDPEACPNGQQCLHGYCFGSPCVAASDCTATGEPCIVTPGDCFNGRCDYRVRAVNEACDDGNACTTGSTCDASRHCGGASVATGQTCSTSGGGLDGVCVAVSGQATCSPDYCYIGGGLVPEGTPATLLPCAICDPAHNLTDWSAATGTSCTTGGGLDGICVPAVGGGGGGECSDQHCSINGVIYDIDDTSPSNGCSVCDPAASTTAWSPNSGNTCTTGGGLDGVCVAATSGSGGECSDDFCVINGVKYNINAINPTNGCSICDPANTPTDWTPNTGTGCTTGGGLDGVCVSVTSSGGGSGGECSDSHCYINGVLYDENAVKADNPCAKCDPASDPEAWTPVPPGPCTPAGGGNGVCTVATSGPEVAFCRACPLGYAATPIPHCVQPSNWGYWTGLGTSPVQHNDGVSLDWVQADGGGSKSISGNNLAVVINTGSAGAPTITVNGTPLALTASVDYRIVPQSAFHAGGNAPPSVPTASIPDLVAVKLQTLSLTGTSTTVTCTGARPLALASINDIMMQGTWAIHCGTLAVGKGGDGVSTADRFTMLGAAGGGYGGAGGVSGNTSGTHTTAGSSYGRSELQPLLGGSGGGAGVTNKSLLDSALSGNLSDAVCWWFNPAGAGTTVGCSLGTSASHLFQTFNEWLNGSWNTIPTPAAQGGTGGGALQLVSLKRLNVQAKVQAWGQAGASLQDCSATSANFSGSALCDIWSYPLKARTLHATCNTCGDASADSRSWEAWYLQTAGGGGSGGALLLEGAEVGVLGSSGSLLTVEGGGGGAGCHMKSFTGDPPDAAAGPYASFRRITNTASVGWGRTAGQVVRSTYTYSNMSGGSGGIVSTGSNAPWGPANPGDVTGGIAANRLPTGTDVSWGGGGGAAGRVRVNTRSGAIDCSGDCSASFVPTASTICAAASAVQICTFPSAASHFQN